jgi:thioredoxin 1
MEKTDIGFKVDYEEETITFDQVTNLPGLIVLEFGAAWCGHCQAATPAIKEALTEHPTLSHIKIFDGKGKRLGRAFKVKLWPTLILLQAGKEVARLVRPIEVNEVRRFISTIA